MNHHTFFGSKTWLFWLFLGLIFFIPAFFNHCLADDDNLNDRNRNVGRRATRFYKKEDKVYHFIAFSGEYDSDEDSKQTLIKLDHYYRSDKFISDIEMSLDTIYEEQRPANSNDRNKYLIKERDLFKLISSQKFLLIDDWYGIFFNETRHDNEGDSAYRDIVVSGGLGRMFFDRRLEVDLSWGQATGRNITDTTHESSRRNYKRSLFIPSYRMEFLLTDDLRFVSRGYYYSSDAITSYYFNSRLQYKISKKVYLQLSHLFDKREYDLYDRRSLEFERGVNEIRRQTVFGIQYKFD